MGNIYLKTDSILQQFQRDNSKIPSPIKQPKDSSLDNIILFSNPNKPGKAAIESQTNRASEIRDTSDALIIVEEAFKKTGKELDERINAANLSEEEGANIAEQNLTLLQVREKHVRISAILDTNERSIERAKLAVEAGKAKLPMVRNALLKLSQAEPGNLDKAVD